MLDALQNVWRRVLLSFLLGYRVPKSGYTTQSDMVALQLNSGRMDNSHMECDGVSEGVFITRPTADSSEFSVTVMFVLPHAQHLRLESCPYFCCFCRVCTLDVVPRSWHRQRWKWAGWALPHIVRLAHLAEKCIQWLLNRPGIAELRKLDEEHYVAAGR